MTTCLYEDCHESAVEGTEHGFQLCRKHLSRVRYIGVCTPDGFTPDPEVTPIPRVKPKKKRTKFWINPRREAVRIILRNHPNVANLFLVREFGFAKETIAKVRERMESTGEIPTTAPRRRVELDAPVVAQLKEMIDC